MKYCHDLGYCHRDLKPENIFLEEKFNIKVADFGFASQLDKENDGKLYSMLGTPGYMAPEINRA